MTCMADKKRKKLTCQFFWTNAKILNDSAIADHLNNEFSKYAYDLKRFAKYLDDFDFSSSCTGELPNTSNLTIGEKAEIVSELIPKSDLNLDIEVGSLLMALFVVLIEGKLMTSNLVLLFMIIITLFFMLALIIYAAFIKRKYLALREALLVLRRLYPSPNAQNQQQQ